MAILDLDQATGHIGSLGGIMHGLAKAVSALAARRARRETLTILAGLTPHQLEDFGLDRSAVLDALAGDDARLWAEIDRRNAAD